MSTYILSPHQKTFLEASITILSSYGETGTAILLKRLFHNPYENNNKFNKEVMIAKMKINEQTLLPPEDVETTKKIPLSEDDEEVLTQTVKYLDELKQIPEKNALNRSIQKIKNMSKPVQVVNDEDNYSEDNTSEVSNEIALQNYNKQRQVELLAKLTSLTPGKKVRNVDGKLVDLPKELLDVLEKFSTNESGDIVVKSDVSIGEDVSTTGSSTPQIPSTSSAQVGNSTSPLPQNHSQEPLSPSKVPSTSSQSSVPHKGNLPVFKGSTVIPKK